MCHYQVSARVGGFKLIEAQNEACAIFMYRFQGLILFIIWKSARHEHSELSSVRIIKLAVIFNDESCTLKERQNENLINPKNHCQICTEVFLRVLIDVLLCHEGQLHCHFAQEELSLNRLIFASSRKL